MIRSIGIQLLLYCWLPATGPVHHYEIEVLGEPTPRTVETSPASVAAPDSIIKPDAMCSLVFVKPGAFMLRSRACVEDDRCGVWSEWSTKAEVVCLASDIDASGGTGGPDFSEVLQDFGKQFPEFCPEPVQ